VIPDNIRLLALPPYAPELNPQEHVWDELREKEFPNRVFSHLDAYSGASCPLIPGEVVHRFRRKLSRDSGAMLSTFSPERNRWTRSRNEWTQSRNLF
jgi:transposase